MKRYTHTQIQLQTNTHTRTAALFIVRRKKETQQDEWIRFRIYSEIKSKRTPKSEPSGF